jgi:anti-sigma factor RsiW
VPPFLTPGQLKALRVRIKILKISAAGQILDFEVQNRSADQSFNNAAIFAIRRFSPKDGGNVFLPAPDAKTLELVNRRGMVVDLDGSLFRR